ncbi:MAG: hypothetical protein K2W80_14140 [Burkholderiales bacterium]|nr:hypothetical protein [Burkholderiales bacterium]
MDAVASSSLTPSPDTEQRSPTADPVQALAATLLAEFALDKAARYEQEIEWLKDYRQYRGVYDPDILARLSKARSRAFIRLTRAKVRAMTSSVFEMLFPAGDRNFTTTPTPVPDLDPTIHAAIFARALQDAQITDPSQLDKDAALKLVREFADKAAKKDQDRLDDYLSEANYDTICREVMRYGHLYGTGVLKGPLTEAHVVSRWVDKTVGEQIVTEVVEEEKRRPGVECRPIWCVYPDRNAADPDSAEHFFDRHILNRAQLVKLAKRRGFDAKAILEHVLRYPDGDAQQLEHWESELKIVGNRITQGPPRNRFLLLERWGMLYGNMLRQIGITQDPMRRPIRDDEQYESQVWILGNRVVKAVLNPMPTKYRPYHFYFFERDEGCFWGEGVARIYRDPQSLFNAAIRVSIDNAAIAGGPITEINRDLLEDEEDAEEIGPFRTYIRNGIGEDAKAPAIRVYEVPSYVDQNLRMASVFKELGDEVSTVPSYQYGQNAKGVASTVGGLEMLMGRNEQGIKDVAVNWDKGITEPFIGALYDWMMMYDRDQAARGDSKIQARGASALVSRMLRAQSLMQFRMSTSNELDAPYIKRGQLIEAEARALNLPPHDYVRTEEEVQATGANLPPEVMAHIQQLTEALQAKTQEADELADIAENALADAKDEREDAAAEAAHAIERIRAAQKDASAALTIMQERTKRMETEARLRDAEKQLQKLKPAEGGKEKKKEKSRASA